jgi:hypothetical protein
MREKATLGQCGMKKEERLGERQRSFCISSMIVIIPRFADQTVSVTTTQLCLCPSTKAIHNKRGRACLGHIKMYL